jgi:hypothetical protein
LHLKQETKKNSGSEENDGRFELGRRERVEVSVDSERGRRICTSRWIVQERDERAVGQRDQSEAVDVDERIVLPRKGGGGAGDALVDELSFRHVRDARCGASDRAPHQHHEIVGHLQEHDVDSDSGIGIVEGDGGENAGQRNGREAAKIVFQSACQEHHGRCCRVGLKRDGTVVDRRRSSARRDRPVKVCQLDIVFNELRAVERRR